MSLYQMLQRQHFVGFKAQEQTDDAAVCSRNLQQNSFCEKNKKVRLGKKRKLSQEKGKKCLKKKFLISFLRRELTHSGKQQRRLK